MKKIFLSLLTTIIFFTASQAQTMVTGGFRRAGTNKEGKTMQVERIKSKLNISQELAESVEAIQQDFMLKMRAVKMDSQYSQDVRKSKLAELQAQRKEALLKILSEKQIELLDSRKLNRKNKHKIASVDDDNDDTSSK